MSGGGSKPPGSWGWPSGGNPATYRKRALSREQNRRRQTGAAVPQPAPEVPAVRHRTCQWPAWSDDQPVPRPPVFCGAPTVPGCSYCATHRARMVCG